MMGKAMLVIGAATGYVFGTRAGRERYEQIKSSADRLWHDPKVQARAAQAQEFAKEKAPQVQEKLTKAAKKAKSGDGEDSMPGTTPDGSVVTDSHRGGLDG